MNYQFKVSNKCSFIHVTGVKNSIFIFCVEQVKKLEEQEKARREVQMNALKETKEVPDEGKLYLL